MPKALKKIFSWVVLELAGREWYTVPPPPPGGEPSLGDGSPRGGGESCTLGGAGHGGGGVS